jgi:hypothetical protein
MAASTRRARLAGCAPFDFHIAVAFISKPHAFAGPKQVLA